MLNCRELVQETTAEPDLASRERRLRWSVRLHLMMCRHCRRYVRQMRALLGLLAQKPPETTADAATVDRIWRALRDRPHAPD